MAKRKIIVRRKPLSEINVVPYIDVMLVLLVVFMATARLMTSGVQVDLPDADAEPVQLPKDQRYIVVTVDKDGRYFMSDNEEKGTPHPLPELAQAVQAEREKNPEIPVLMEGDERVAYGIVIQAMVALQRVGINDVGLITENSGEE